MLGHKISTDITINTLMCVILAQLRGVGVLDQIGPVYYSVVLVNYNYNHNIYITARYF